MEHVLSTPPADKEVEEEEIAASIKAGEEVVEGDAEGATPGDTAAGDAKPAMDGQFTLQAMLLSNSSLVDVR